MNHDAPRNFYLQLLMYASMHMFLKSISITQCCNIFFFIYASLGSYRVSIYNIMYRSPQVNTAYIYLVQSQLMNDNKCVRQKQLFNILSSEFNSFYLDDFHTMQLSSQHNICICAYTKHKTTSNTNQSHRKVIEKLNKHCRLGVHFRL